MIVRRPYGERNDACRRSDALGRGSVRLDEVELWCRTILSRSARENQCEFARRGMT